MTFQTIQARHAAKHLDKISNVRCYSLDNSFSGELVEDQARAIDFALNRMGGKLQVSKTERQGKIRLHSNLWYNFDYAA
jgi:hypothetical protein